MNNELQDLLQEVAKTFNKTLDKFCKLSDEKLNKTNPTWDDIIQLSKLEKHLSKILNQYKTSDIQNSLTAILKK